MSLFVLSPEIADRDEVEIDNWANKTKAICSGWLFFKVACSIFRE
jgi:hypothetical protein